MNIRVNFSIALHDIDHSVGQLLFEKEHIVSPFSYASLIPLLLEFYFPHKITVVWLFSKPSIDVL